MCESHSLYMFFLTYTHTHTSVHLIKSLHSGRLIGGFIDNFLDD